MRFESSRAIGAALALLVPATQAIVPSRQPHQPLGNGTRLLGFNNTVVSSKFKPSSSSVTWFAGGEDGTFVQQASDHSLVLENIVTGSNRTLVPADRVPADSHDYWIRPDLKKVLFATNYTKQYRHSYFANYLVLDVDSGDAKPLVEDQAGDIQYAEFAPEGDAIVFVRGNNLFISPSAGGNATQITSDGDADLFHGVPDWVYEEEVFGDRKTLWWAPDASYLAFLSFNETGVGRFTVPYYLSGHEFAPSYPRELELRYPKVGSTNPKPSLSLLKLDGLEVTDVDVDAFAEDDLVIGEVAWVTDSHSSLVYRAFNRVQDHEKVVRVDVGPKTSHVLRERDGSDGWLDSNLAVAYVGPINGSANGSDWYLDLSDESGWNHLYLYPVAGGDPIPLTSGEYEVLSYVKIDTSRQLVFYLSTEHHSTERHLYSVSYKTGKKTALVDDSVPGYWSASFSSKGSYYILSYSGPDVPYQDLYSINSTTPIRTITSNKNLWNELQGYKLPNITYFELENRDENFTLNVMQRLPANFDPAKKYPVLFTPYGGPGAQEVTKSFQSLNWNAYISSDPELEYVTYTVDNRGTGNKGRAFRASVTKQLGLLEPLDQIWAARELLSRNSFLDADHVAIFGWSFGGFLTAKTLEADSGVFATGLIVAPVSDWRLYDSVYTERYMKTLADNEAGYEATAVSRTAGFRNARGGFSILHGTGDDNVHYQNTAALVDRLIAAGVPPGQINWLAFTDSDHRIAYNGDNVWLYKYLTAALYKEKNRRPKGTLVHQWGKRGLEVPRE